MTMRHMLRAGLPCALALAVGCQRTASNEISDEIDSGLVITAADPQTAIEARYHEGSRALVLRARTDAARVTSEIVDDRGHSLTQLAHAIVDHGQGRTAGGARAVPVAALMANTAQLRTALRLARHGLRELRDAIDSDAADSAAFRQLSEQTALLRQALRDSRLALLQEWGSEVRQQIAMTPDEHARFFAILNRQAAAIAAGPGQRRGAAARNAPGAAAGAGAGVDDELAALLGTERYARYQTHRKAWLAPAGDETLEVMP